MKLLSIDIGIKNLAIIIIETNTKTNIPDKTSIPDKTNTTDNSNITDDSNNIDFKIIKWDVINLCEKNIDCSEPACKKKPFFFKNTSYYCKIHAKKTNYSIPLCNINTLHKQSLKKLILCAQEYNIIIDKSIKKPSLIVLLEQHLNSHCLQEVENVSANSINLVHIGIAIKNELNKLFKDYNILELDKIILENQISPIANRMKTIQGMIAQYFINYNNYNIYFISAINKLKFFLKNKNNENNNENNENNNKLNYANRKKLSIYYTKEVLQKYNMSNEIAFFSNHKKKDDLADCFLQAYYYINNNK